MNKSKKFLAIILAISLLCSLFTIYTSAAAVKNGGLYYIQNRRSKLYLTASGSNLVQSSLTRNENQRFFIREVSTKNNIKYYSLTPDSDHGKRVDVANSVDADFQKVGIFTNNPNYP